jgi:hypothetical protein
MRVLDLDGITEVPPFPETSGLQEVNVLYLEMGRQKGEATVKRAR